MELKPNCGSDRAWVWSTPADFADEESKPELLAIRFANAESKLYRLMQTLQQLLGFYQTEDTFWPDFADIKHNYTEEFYRSYSPFISQ